jgi:uncharacterized protein YjiS (DUF1127 family)
MSSLVKPSSVAFRVVSYNKRPRTWHARTDGFAGLAASLAALGQLRDGIAVAARRLLREWCYRVKSRRELRLYADEIVRDTEWSRYEIELELSKPFWRA